MSDEMKNVFDPYIWEDEIVLWEDKPDTRVYFTPADILLVPVSIWIGYFFLDRGLSYVTTAISLGYISAGIFVLVLWGTLFILMGCYLVLGRFLYKNWRKKHTYYGLTNKRVLVYVRGRRIVTELLSEIPSLRKSIRRNGIGTITFGHSPFTASWCGNSGMNCLAGFDQWDLFAFHDIRNADYVYELIETLRNYRW